MVARYLVVRLGSRPARELMGAPPPQQSRANSVVPATIAQIKSCEQTPDDISVISGLPVEQVGFGWS
jgi:hypothetical protein